MKADNEQLTGDLKDVVGEVIAPGLDVELDVQGGIHIAVFRLPRDQIGDRESLTLDIPGGRTLDLFLLRNSFHADGSIHAAVVNDTGHVGYSLGLGLGPVDEE